MKKKLIQVFMLLVATISVGSFVSCKDTNEDLYNELRSQMVPSNATLQQALAQQQSKLADLLQEFKNLQAAMPAPCACNETAMQADIDALKTAVAGLKTAVDGLEDDVDGINDDITGINGNITGIKTDIQGLKDAILALQKGLNDANVDITGLTASFTTEISGIKDLIGLLQAAMGDKADQATVDAVVGDLKNQIANIKTGLDALNDQNLLALISAEQQFSKGLQDRIVLLEGLLASLKNDSDDKFGDILTRLAKAEQAIIDNKAWMDQQLADIKGDITAAQTTADNAFTLANTAKTSAELALNEAKRIEGLANAAQAAADKAQGDATAAQKAAQDAQAAADLAYALAAQAMATANKVNDLAVTVATLTGKVEANEQAIAKLQQDTKDLRNLIDQNKDKLQDAIDKVNGDLENKIDGLKTDINDKIDALKSELQGKIDNLDGKLQDKVYELTSKISELQNSVITNAKDIEANAKAIATNADNIKANADAIDKIQEQIGKFEASISLATEKANQAYKEASEAKAKADANEQSISDLKVKVGVNEANIKNLKETTDDLKDAVNDLKTQMAQIGVNTKAIEDLAKTVDDTKDALQDLQSKYDDLEDQLSDLKAELVEAKAECSKNLTEAKAYVDTQMATLKAAVVKEIADALNNYYDKDALNKILEGYAKASDLNGLATQDDLDKLGDDLTDLNDKFYKEILALYDKITDGDKQIGDKLYDLAQRVAANEQHLEDIDKVLQTMDAKFKDYVPRETLIAWYWLLMDRINTVDGKVDGMKDQIKNELSQWINNDLINDIKDQLPDLIKEVLGDDTNFVTKDDLEDLVNNLIKDKVDASDFADALLDLAALEARVTALENGTVKLGDYNVDKGKIWSAIDKANDEIGGLQDAVKTINDKLPTMESDIAKLKGDVKAVQDKLANEIEPKINALTADVKAIQDYLGQQITGISIQGTHNPMFGSFSIPANIQSNVLIAYYGRPSTAVEFPTTDDVMYVRKEEVLTDDDWTMINGDDIVFTQRANKTLMNEYETTDETGARVLAASAGKVYVTVNPTSVNANKLQLKIVNSQDEESLINLSPLRRSSATLQFGFSRADNAFYEADAYVKIADLDNVDRPFSEQAIKDLGKVAKEQFRNILNNSMAAGSTGLDGLATQVYEVVRSLRLDQSGVKCPFKAADGVTDLAVYSQYNLAATAVKPITLGFGKDFNYYTVPGYERVEGLLNRISNTLKSKFKTALTKGTGMVQDIVDGIDISKIELKDLKDETVARFEITIGDDVSIDGLTYHMQIPEGASVPVMFGSHLTVNGQPVNIPADLFVDEDATDPDVAALTLVVTGNVTSTSVPMRIVIPVTNDAVKKYVWYDLEEGQIPNTGFSMGTGLAIDNRVVARFSLSASYAGYDITPAATPLVVQLNEMIDLSSGTTPTLHLSFTYDLRNEMAEVWGNSQDAVGNVRDLLENLLADINDTLDRIRNYENKFNTLVDSFFGPDGKLHGYLDKINNPIVNFVNGINWQLGPFIVAEDINGFKVMSANKSMPTVMSKNTLRIYPTSKNLEIVVPFARKHVAVTNVFKGSASAQGGDADCVAKLKAANTGDLNKVIDGTQRMIEVTGVERGYTYEFAYSVLDFNGNISTRKTYIRIK